MKDKILYKKHERINIALWLSIGIFVLLLLFFLQSIASIEKTTSKRQLESLQNAINRSITQCYAVEGMYPPDLEYLTNHYGITFDQDVFLVDYNFFGSNLFPEVTILRKG